MNPFAQLSDGYKRSLTAWSRFYRRSDSFAAVNLEDPLGGALMDTDLLLAYAAQSSRRIKADKVRVLTFAADAVRQARAADNGNRLGYADKVAAFWIAFDDLSVDMAPLSAHSIRSSMEVNGKCFPASLHTPTAYNGALAVLVFALALALQGFWGAGKELVDSAAAYDLRKFELLTTLSSQTNAFERASKTLLRRACVLDNSCYKTTVSTEPVGARLLSAVETAALRAETNLLELEVMEKQIVLQELSAELGRLDEKGYPLESLVRRWHERARRVCDREYFEYLCPVDYPVKNNTLQEQAQVKLNRAQIAYDVGHRQPKEATLKPMLSFFSENAQRFVALQKAKDELRKAEATRHRSIMVETRITVANLGTYLIPMVMGILGALTYILRSLSLSLKEHTYVPASAIVFIVRVCLGAIAGVFGSLFASGGDPTLKTLPPLFIPFVFGYGIEILFSLLDRVVRTFTQPENTSTPHVAR